MKIRNFPCLRFLFFALLILAVPAASHAQVRVGVSIRVGPPALPVYAQPICPGPGYIWTPGYWAYGDDGYYWVPGTWVLAPEPGLLWTPGYWGWGEGVYLWHRGYWGPHVGFYGGINYGFGYPGVGFVGGEWRGREFFYNRSVNRVNVTIIHNVYDRHVDERFVSRVSFNGGHGGIDARPSREDEAYDHEHHFDATREQDAHRDEASHNRAQFASYNHGRPDVAATPRPGAFNDRGAVHGNDRGGNNRGNSNNGNRGQRFDNNANGNRNGLRNDNRNRPENRPSHPNNARPERNQRNNKEHPAKPDHKPGKPGKPDGRGDHRHL
ncbi:MAG: YXWGXW repeat-containing protein [Candidatus Acidiferrales bacterium]